MHYSRGTGREESLKRGGPSAAVTLWAVQCPWGMGQEAGSGAGLGQQRLLPVPVLGGKEQQECSGRASRACAQDWP